MCTSSPAMEPAMDPVRDARRDRPPLPGPREPPSGGTGCPPAAPVPTAPVPAPALAEWTDRTLAASAATGPGARGSDSAAAPLLLSCRCVAAAAVASEPWLCPGGGRVPGGRPCSSTRQPGPRLSVWLREARVSCAACSSLRKAATWRRAGRATGMGSWPTTAHGTARTVPVHEPDRRSLL